MLTDRIANITAFVIPVVEQWLEQEIAQWDQSDNPSHDEQTLYHGRRKKMAEMFNLMTQHILYGV